MEYKKPKTGEIYRHFKGNLYEVLMIAKHSETLEEMVVYQGVDGGQIFVRPLEMFVGPVDKIKYPDVLQTERFQLQTAECDLSIMDFLDLKTAKDKMQYLETRKEFLTESFLGIVAQSLDFVENDGSKEERLGELLQYLRTLAKYEAR